METLTNIFGYRGALHIKDASCYLVGVSFGALVMIWLMANFYLNVDVADEEVVPPLSAIVKAGSGKMAKYYINPSSTSEVVDAFIGYVILLVCPKLRYVRYKNVRVIITILVLLMLLQLGIGALFVTWVYLP